MSIAIYIFTVIAIIVFLIYSGLAIHNARKFRYLSTRTVYLTWLFVAISTILIVTIVTTALLIEL